MMTPAGAVLICAVKLLGRDLESFPPIYLVATVPQFVSRNAEGFVRRDTGAIYVVTTSEAFAAAQQTGCRDNWSLRKIASVLIHEEAHLRYGADESAAYRAQLAALLKLSVSPNSRLYQGVLRSMQLVVQSRRNKVPVKLFVKAAAKSHLGHRYVVMPQRRFARPS